MPKDYDLETTPPNKILRSEYACDDEWVRSFLERAQVGHVGTRWDEQPFVTPVLFWYDSQRNEIYFHTNITGRLQANSERHEQVCFEACKMGKLLPATVALEFGVQYESAVVFGRIHLLQDPEDQRRVLYGLIEKYFPGMTPGEHYRPITELELKRTAVFAIAIDSWSGKRNWSTKAE
ncbi:MAG: pyridoxamine 5'-phosphate oxidase family protein [Anaerolineales bacterium]|nr:pyridoxamine 5'-phosphate oxidase family protein [Anaerolineales bacterium]